MSAPLVRPFRGRLFVSSIGSLGAPVYLQLNDSTACARLGGRVEACTGKMDDGAERKNRDLVSFLDILNIMAKRKWLILISTMAATALAVAFSITSLVLPPATSPLPNEFTGKALVMLKAPSSSSSSAALGELSGLASLLGSSGGDAPSPTDLVLALAKQESFLDQLEADLSLIEHYGASTARSPRMKVRSIILNMLEAKMDETSGIMTISYRDTDRDFAARAANRAVEILKARYAEVTMRMAQDRLSAIEDSIVSARAMLAHAQERFTAFQNQHGIYDMQSSASVTLDMVNRAGQELLELQNRYRTLSAYRPADDPALVGLKDQIEQAKARIQELRKGSSELGGLVVAPDKLTEIASEYALLKGDLSIQQGIYATLKQQLEMTRIEEISGSRIFSIIQEALPPEMKSGPSRGLLCIVVAMAAFFLSVLASFILEYAALVSRDPEEAPKLAELRSNLRLGRRSR